MLDGDCLSLIIGAVRSDFPNITAPTPHQIHERNAELVKLRRVRRSWKDSIDSQPYLWNSIAFIMGDRASMKSAMMFLRYSQTATIHLYGHGGSSKLDKHTRNLAYGLRKKLQAASPRIVSFHIIKPTPAMLRLWPASAPNLEGMAIDTKTPFPALFRGEMPLLRSAAAPVLNENQYSIAQNLTSLILYPPYTFERLLATLKNTPMLRKLELKRISKLGRSDLQRVSLPHLEALCLSGCFHPVIGFIDFPAQARITISVPANFERCMSLREIGAMSSFLIPPPFLRSSTMKITTREVRRPTQVQIVGQDTGNGYRCHVCIDFGKGSRVGHRYNVCVLAMGLAQNMTSVSSLLFEAQARFPAKFTSLLKQFSRLNVIRLAGPCAYPILADFVSADVDTVPSLKHLIINKALVPVFQKFKDVADLQEGTGRRVVHYLNLGEVGK